MNMCSPEKRWFVDGARVPARKVNAPPLGVGGSPNGATPHRVHFYECSKVARLSEGSSRYVSAVIQSGIPRSGGCAGPERPTVEPDLASIGVAQTA